MTFDQKYVHLGAGDDPVGILMSHAGVRETC